MDIIYPYNEILPKKTAHDVYIFQNCASLALSGANVQLLCGRGSWDDKALLSHYLSGTSQPIPSFHIQRLFILRRNFFCLSWNLPFYWQCQRRIEREKPDLVITSVIKQADYHHARKVRGVRYIYEAHQLAWYPSMPQEPVRDKIAFEKQVFERADLVTVTTSAMREILLKPPYGLKTPIAVVPLAVNTAPLPPKDVKAKHPLTLMYIGQLYKGQGIDLLLSALKNVPEVRLEVVGGSESDVTHYRQVARALGIQERVLFHGFHPPAAIAPFAERADAFVTTFGKEGRMPYVAHTKLLEYIAWRRPVIAPDLPIVRDHFPGGQGIHYFEPENPDSLCRAIQQLHQHGSSAPAFQDVSWKARTELYREQM